MTTQHRRLPRLAFCTTCNARERAIVAGRCHICGNDPAKTNKHTETKEQS